MTYNYVKNEKTGLRWIVEENTLNKSDFFVLFRKLLLKVQYFASKIQNYVNAPCMFTVAVNYNIYYNLELRKQFAFEVW